MKKTESKYDTVLENNQLYKYNIYETRLTDERFE